MSSISNSSRNCSLTTGPLSTMMYLKIVDVRNTNSIKKSSMHKRKNYLFLQQDTHIGSPSLRLFIIDSK